MIALPAWQRVCEDLGLKPRLIPCDVVTRWNSTYNMLCFIFEYRKVIDAITANKGLKLHKFELDEDDWMIVEDLVYVLEVHTYQLDCCHKTNHWDAAIQASNHLFLTRHDQHRLCHPSHGSNQRHPQPSYQEAVSSSHPSCNEARIKKARSVLLTNGQLLCLSNRNGYVFDILLYILCSDKL